MYCELWPRPEARTVSLWVRTTGHRLFLQTIPPFQHYALSYALTCALLTDNHSTLRIDSQNTYFSTWLQKCRYSCVLVGIMSALGVQRVSSGPWLLWVSSALGVQRVSSVPWLLWVLALSKAGRKEQGGAAGWPGWLSGARILTLFIYIYICIALREL